jgi:mRNA interferase HigB
MHIFAKSTLLRYAQKHPEVKGALLTWHQNVSKAKWLSPNDVKKKHTRASIINTKRVVFDINPGAHRLVVDIEYKWGLVFVVAIMTHKEYDRINVEDLEYNG